MVYMDQTVPSGLRQWRYVMLLCFSNLVYFAPCCCLCYNILETFIEVCFECSALSSIIIKSTD